MYNIKIQGVKKVVISINNANENVKNFYLSFGLHFTMKIDKADYYYELEF